MLVVAHGAGGEPEPHCERWRQLVGDRGFLLCLRGKGTYSHGGIFYYPDHHWLGRALEAALQALRDAYGDRVDTELAAYTGYSQGANMGALALMKRPGLFSRLLFVEGQQNDWSIKLAERWHQAGGKRVALACGLAKCIRAARQSEWILRRGGMLVETRYAAGAGHTYLGPVGEHVRELFEWLVEDDPRWRSD